MENREKKFIAWDRKNGKMINHFAIQSNGNILFTSRSKFGQVKGYDNERFIILQYTGLKDKNGKEIYDGDLIGGIWKKHYIGWCDKCIGYQVFNCLKECSSCSGDVHWSELVQDKDIEVIGNIYENPELLE